MEDNYPDPQIRTSKTAYTVWLLPLIALILAVWLIYKNVTDAGIRVSITFPDANGIIAKKTAVKFRGIEVGRVKTLKALEDGSGVLASVEMNQDTEPYLTDKLKFWLVKPNVSYGGISGLDTLLSGAYIQVDGGEEVKKGNATRYFEALVGAPPVDIASGLLVYKLVTSNASGVNKGAMIYHRNILVGSVHDVQLSDDHQSVEITVAIEPKYKGLVKRASRFWSISGVKASFDLSGVKVESHGLVPMLIGGVAFNSPAKSAPAQEQTLFRLYPSADAARDSLEISLTFPPGADVKIGSDIYLDQQKVGEIDTLDWDDNFEHLTGTAKLSMDMASLMHTDTQFWLDSPALSINNLNVGQLIQGTVIRFSPGSEGNSTEFAVLEQSPYKKWAASGLHLILTSKDAYSIQKGTGIYYKSQVIGQIQWLDFDPDEQIFTLDALIFPRFTSMIKQNSLFYNLSGIDFSAQLKGVKMTMPSLKQLVGGGIGVYLDNRNEDQQKPLVAKSIGVLHKNLEAAIAGQTDEQPDHYLLSPDLLSPAVGSGVYYRQFEIGTVSTVTLADTAEHSMIGIKIQPQFKSLVRDTSQFWLKPALDFKASIHGVKVQAAPLMSMLIGGIELSTFEPSAPTPAKGKVFTLHKHPEAVAQNGQLIHLTIKKQTTLTVGAAVKYRGFKVGEVAQLTLLPDLSGVEASLAIDEPYYGHFSRTDSRYWLVQPKVGLSGIENVATTVFGDYLAVDKGQGGLKTRFVVSQSNLRNINGLALTLQAAQLGSLDQGDPVLYKQLRIGEVTAVALTTDSSKVAINVVIYPQYRHLITLESQFWNASGVKVDAGLFSGVKIDTQTLESIVAGGISLATSLDGEPAQKGQVFPLHEQAQDNWLTGLISR